MLKQNIAALSFQNLAIGYGDRVVSDGLTACLETGKVTCLLGANGSGKSTLLRTLTGYLPRLAGDMTKVAPESVGIVLTEQMDTMGLRVWEVVAMGRHPYTGYFGRFTSFDEEIVRDAMNKINIVAFSDRKFDSLSDGEKQKVMIAKALAQQTAIIVMDEPSAFLDFTSKVDLMVLLKKLAHENGKAILLSTHDVGIALKTADVLWLMHKGAMTVGSPDELVKRGDIDCFLGESKSYI
jgi:iron complex transport system ATP-binding protein